MAETQIDCAVLIVGAGPVGLTLANELHRWGVPFRIVDKKQEPERHSKAANLWPRTQEVFAAIGVLDRLLERSAPLHTFSLHGYGKLLGHIPMDRQPSPYGTPAFIGQNEIERVLSRGLDEVGASVERAVTVVEIADHDDHAEAVLERAGGGRETVHARWLVSCEGGASLARKAAGLDFQPARLRNHFIRQIDAQLRWSRPRRFGHASFFLKRDGYMGILPLPGGYYRMFVLSDDAGAPAERDPTLEEMQAILREIAEDPAAELSDPVWFSHGRFNHGVAPCFRKNSILLAGDAAHMTLPIYGQGMNTGMQDAFNLGWKLGFVLNGWAPEALLDSYDAERRPVRETLNAEQTRVLHTLAKPSWLRQQVVRGIGAAVLAKGAAKQFARRSSQLDIAYGVSPLNQDGVRGGNGVKAGERAPDAVLVEADGLRTVSLFEAIYGEQWTLLQFDGGQEDVGHALTSVVDVLASWPQVALRPMLAAPRVGGSVITPESLLDIDRFAHKAYGLERPTLVLIRPDGYVAFRDAATATARLEKYLRRHLTPKASPDVRRR